MFVVALFLIACSNSGKATQTVKCLPQGEECGDGVCDGCEDCSTCAKDCCPDSCIETDGGKNDIVSGKISGTYKGEKFEYSDYCMNSKTKASVLEYYCGGEMFNIPSNIRLECEKGCQSGACIS
jgi:hypothetical protein